MRNEPIVINIMNNEIKLDEDCWACEHETWVTDGVCSKCHDTGYTLTDAGEAIVNLIKRHNSEAIK